MMMTIPVQGTRTVGDGGVAGPASFMIRMIAMRIRVIMLMMLMAIFNISVTKNID